MTALTGLPALAERRRAGMPLRWEGRVLSLDEADAILSAGPARLAPVAVVACRAPLAAPPELAAARRALCSSCSSWQAGRCSAVGCSCTGHGLPGNLLSRCPVGAWGPGPLPAMATGRQEPR